MTDSDGADSNRTMSPVKDAPQAVVSEDLPLSTPRSSAISVPTTVNGNLLSLEHFPAAFEAPLDSRRCSSRSSRFGRLSPTHSAHGNLLRHTLLQVSQEKKAKKVRFYRNGDRFFKGMIYAVSPERFRTFESLLADLTTSPVCDNKVLPNGVRYLFTLDGMKKMTSLDQLEEGQSYVCASTDAFKRIDYSKSSNPGWNPNSRSQPDGALTAKEAGGEDPDEKPFVRPKLVTVIRNGTKPRRAVRILLNRKTAHSFDQVMTDITSAIKLDTGTVRRLYTLDGRPIQGLPDFFKDDSVFIAYGPEKQSLDDFDLDDREVRFVSAYQSVRERKRVTLKSPKLPRKPSNFSVLSRNGFSPTGSPGSPTPQRYTFSSSPAGSPSLQRKMEIL